MDKNYRIHTNIASDTILNVNMTQDYDFLEVLTMKLRQKDAYKLHSSNYGVIIGRVLANDAFGIPNAKISVFIERDTNDSVDMENIYPYSEVTSKDKDGRRYNLLPDYSNDDCYRIVGTFPNKRLLLDNDIQLEIYDKYWKYTTVTNNAGDYMIFGVPSGNQQIHVDIDLSDIGILSQKPRDFEYKGYNVTMFDNPNQFKESTNLDSLAQLFSQDKSVYVYPFWGDDDNGIAAITRCDVEIQYKFEPTCVFMGSIVSDNEGNSIGHKCAPDVNNGMNDQLIAGEGTIEMIRKTQDGLIEEYQIQGNQLIDSNGVWCYQIPMNLDYIGTDEYGNIVPTDNPSKGIPTRTQVRFRISKHDSGDEGFSNHTAKYLVPMNPIFSEKTVIESNESDSGLLDGVQPVIEMSGQEVENMYVFGSNTPQHCFRDLYWNNVYSVKNYIPKVQVATRPYAKNYGALKGSNLAEDSNPIPFNKLRVDLPFLYVIVCIIFDIIIYVVGFINIILNIINKTVIFIIRQIISAINILTSAVEGVTFGAVDIPDIPKPGYIPCISIGEGLSDEYVFLPGCEEGSDGWDVFHPDDENLEKSNNLGKLRKLVTERLAEEFKIIKLDFYQDWLNGCLYMPLWYWRKRKKKTYLFGLITRRAKNQFCDCNEQYGRLRTYVTCNVKYGDNSLLVNADNAPLDSKDWHKRKADWVRYIHGLIKGVQNNDGLTAYYYAATQATTENKYLKGKEIAQRTTPFYAVRLYATDIILLGNLNEDNLYGIPQLFKVLPDTTANIPAIATIEESGEDDEKEQEIVDGENDSEIYNEEDSGTTVTTGMNWGRHGDDVDRTKPKYSDGLFMGLSCTSVETKAKSCFNVERLSELGASLDMTYNMPYTKGGNIEYGEIRPDGFISKLELDDMENRAMFATMNHIGFVPQTYQDSISGYTTQVEDERTNYLVPKFRYVYPVDFDGRQQYLMNQYKNSFTQHMFDEDDESYLTFRLGADKDPNEKGEKNRLRHFYHHYGDNTYSMPVYNNSFYFYFGIKKGSTAIDKFNNMFYADCFRNSKKPFTFSIDSRGSVLCPSIYQEGQEPYGYIKFDSDDIQTPFSYTLYSPYGEVIIHEDDMETTEFVIGGTLDGEIVKPNKYGQIKYQKEPHSAICESNNSYIDCIPDVQNSNYVTLSSSTYVLSVTDANDRTLSQEIELIAPVLSYDYNVTNLGTKFLTTDVTTKEFICGSENEFYGVIRIIKFYVDGYEFKINSATPTHRSNSYYVSVTGTPVDTEAQALFRGTVIVNFALTALNDDTTENCLCNYPFVSGEGWFEFHIYQPGQYSMSMSLLCGNELVGEITQNINVGNGEEFDAKLNGMPIRFMLGGYGDSDSKFYSSTESPISITTSHESMQGWRQAHIEDSYRFDLFPTTEDYETVWAKYVDDMDNITSIGSKKKIIKYKFDTMFSLSNGVYMCTNSPTFTYSAVGGIGIPLNRALYPNYSQTEEFDEWFYSDETQISNDGNIPNIVGSNYFSDSAKTPSQISGARFNELFSGRLRPQHGQVVAVSQYIGNYFSVFSNNGKYVNSYSGDCYAKSISIPTNTAINLTPAVNREWKPLGEKEVLFTTDTSFENVLRRAADDNRSDAICSNISNTNPYLRAMYVDRKLDYDLILMTPTNVNLYPEAAEGATTDKNIPIHTTRISGFTYNGIEMSYDDEYYIISVNEDGRPNSRLEYTYRAVEGITIHNTSERKTIVWDIQDEVKAINNHEVPHYLPKYHTAKINDRFDFRKLFWSTFNRAKLNDYIANVQGGSGVNRYFATGQNFYLFNHDIDSSLYNGEYNLTNYPTKRFIDVGNIEGGSRFSLSLASCSYNITANYKDGNVSGNIKNRKCDNLDLTIRYSNVVRFMRDSDSYDYGHLVFGCNGEVVDGYNIYTTTTADLCFKYNSNLDTTGFNVYALPSRVIRVISDRFNENSSSGDGITYFKSASRNDGLFGSKDLFGEYGRLEEITQRYIYGLRLTSIWYDMLCKQWDGCGDLDGDMSRDEKNKYCWMGYFLYDKNPITIKSTQFAKITFRDSFSISDTKLMALMIPLEYNAIGDTHHTKRIAVYNIPEIYDTRNIRLKLTSNGQRSITFTMERSNGSTSMKDMLNQAFDEYGMYECVFVNGDYANTVIPDVSKDGTKIIFKLDNFHDTSYTQFDFYMTLTTTCGFIYNLRDVIEYENGKWGII